MRYPTGFGKNCWMADYRRVMREAALMRRVARLVESPGDAKFLGQKAEALYRAAQRYKVAILLFNSFVPGTGREEESG